ncbi:MAG: hypothetical protein K9L74_01930 [Candidatus Izimaplasma sp.]|nr:hypothetical protein [Candidatus Izimaplasma bacterium]
MEKKPVWIEIAKLIMSFLTIVATVVIAYTATTSITETIQSQTVTQTAIAEQYQLVLQQQIALQSQIVEQQQIANQEIVTLQPRDGDVIIRDEDSYKLVQLIKIEDIIVSSEIQESRYDFDQLSEDVNRVDLFRGDDTDDWSTRDAFQYTLEEISFNPDKVMNLMGNIVSIKLYFDVYEEEDITTKIDLPESDQFYEILYDENNDNNTVRTSFTNLTSENYYVTKSATNDGINHMKLRLEIVYRIDINESESYIIETEIILTDWITIIPKY